VIFCAAEFCNQGLVASCKIWREILKKLMKKIKKIEERMASRKSVAAFRFVLIFGRIQLFFEGLVCRIQDFQFHAKVGASFQKLAKKKSISARFATGKV